MCGFTCDNSENTCAFQGNTCLCGGTNCEICAKLVPNSVLKESRCIPAESELPTIIPKFNLSVECLRKCFDDYAGYDSDFFDHYDCPPGHCCTWEKSGITCDGNNVLYLNFTENLALAKQSPILYGTFPDFLHNMTTLEQISFVGGNLTGTLSGSLGFVDCTSRFCRNSHNNILSSSRSLGQLKNLQISQVGSIRGTIPSSFERLQQLQFLVCEQISSACLFICARRSALPTSCVHGFSQDLSSNFLSGTIPPEVSGLPCARKILAIARTPFDTVLCT